MRLRWSEDERGPDLAEGLLDHQPTAEQIHRPPAQRGSLPVTQPERSEDPHEQVVGFVHGLRDPLHVRRLQVGGFVVRDPGQHDVGLSDPGGRQAVGLHAVDPGLHVARPDRSELPSAERGQNPAPEHGAVPM